MNRWIATTAVASVLMWGLPTGRAEAQHKHGAQGKHEHGKSEKHGTREHGEHKKGKKPAIPKCPVMGDPVDFSVRTMAQDGPVYFCCKDCVKKFKANPGKYAAKVAGQRRALKALPRVQVSCPLSGEPIDAKIFAKHDGRKVYFCCKDCLTKFQKAPARYRARLGASYTYQTRCPVMDDEIDPTAYVDLADGHRVYFCCKGCDKKLLKDPGKYVAKLKAQGIDLDPAKVKRAKPKASKAKTHAKDDHGGHHH